MSIILFFVPMKQSKFKNFNSFINQNVFKIVYFGIEWLFQSFTY